MSGGRDPENTAASRLDAHVRQQRMAPEQRDEARAAADAENVEDPVEQRVKEVRDARDMRCRRCSTTILLQRQLRQQA